MATLDNQGRTDIAGHDASGHPVHIEMKQRELLLRAIGEGHSLDIKSATGYNTIANFVTSDAEVRRAMEGRTLTIRATTEEARGAMISGPLMAIPNVQNRVKKNLSGKKEEAETPEDDWQVTTAPESKTKPGLYVLAPDKAYLGSPKEEKKIDLALRYVHEVDLLGKNPAEQTPNILGDALELYDNLFPNIDEREENSLITKRLGDKEMRRGKNGCYDVIVGRDKQGHVITIHNFSTIPLKGSDEAITFLQYTGVADDEFMRKEHGEAYGNRGQGIMTLNYAAMGKQADENAKVVLDRPKGHKGTILESEYIGQGATDEDIRFTEQRLKIHNQSGAKAIMLKMKDGSMISPHLQPSLGEGAKAIKLLLLFRPAKYDEKRLGEIDDVDLQEAKRLVMAFVDNFDTEGFDAVEVQKARETVQGWFDNAQGAVLYPPSKLPTVTELAAQDPFLAAQCQDDFGDLAEHAQKVKQALAVTPQTVEAHRGS